MNSLPIVAQHYLRSVMLCGAAIGIYAVMGYQVPDLWNLLLITIVATHMATVKVRWRLGGELCSLSLSFLFIFATLIGFGWRAGVIVSVFCALSQSLFNPEEELCVYRILFGVATLVLSVTASGAAYSFCQGELPMSITNISPVALLAGVVTYGVVNTGLISGAVSLSARKPFGWVWVTHLKWTALSFLIGGFLALILAYFFQAVGIGIFVLLYPVFYLIHYAYKCAWVKLSVTKFFAR